MTEFQDFTFIIDPGIMGLYVDTFSNLKEFEMKIESAKPGVRVIWCGAIRGTITKIVDGFIEATLDNGVRVSSKPKDFELVGA